MVDRVNDITWQAHQGSVAAIIQILNDKLADSGVRARAIFENGVLQLLCEAQSIDKLKQSDLVQQIQLILNSIAPRNIRRVNINSRIVKEQQLLWLKDINSNNDSQLLWSQEITLDKPSKVKQVIENFQENQKSNSPQYLTSEFIATDSNSKIEISFFRGMIFVGGMIFATLVAWRAYILFENQIGIPDYKQTAAFVERGNKSFVNSSGSKKNNRSPQLNSFSRKETPFQTDYFRQAVRLANKTSLESRRASTKKEWLQIALNWQRASNLMNSVEKSDSNYTLAQNRVKLYRKYSNFAQKKANEK